MKQENLNVVFDYLVLFAASLSFGYWMHSAAAGSAVFFGVVAYCAFIRK